MRKKSAERRAILDAMAVLERDPEDVAETAVDEVASALNALSRRHEASRETIELYVRIGRLHPFVRAALYAKTDRLTRMMYGNGAKPL